MPPTAPSTENLDADALRAGLTADCCERVVAAHGPLVRAACLRILRDEALAEDAVQETFVLLVRKARTLPPHTPIAGWLYHAACRTALNHLRTTMRRHARETSPEARASLAPETQDDAWRELEPQLDAAMLELPARQRDLVVQCHFQNQSQREAARALGCSESVVSRELSAAIETLRRFFAQRGLNLGSGALVAVLSANAVRGAALAGSARLIAAMLAAAPGAATISLAALAKLVTTKIAVTTGLVLAVGAIVFDLASPHSRLAGIFQRSATVPAANLALAAASPPPPEIAALKPSAQEAATQEAAAMFAALPRFPSGGALRAALIRAVLCRDVDEQLAMFHRLGITISREALEAVVQGSYWWTRATVPSNLSSYSASEVARLSWAFPEEILEAWAREAPQAVLAWIVSQPVAARGMQSDLLPMLCAAVRSERLAPALWDALLAGAPSPDAAEYVVAYRQLTDDPAAFLKKPAPQVDPSDPRAGLRSTALRELMKSDPSAALSAAVASGDASFLESAVKGVAGTQKSVAAVRKLAGELLGDLPAEANLLRALGGDSTASFVEAIRQFADARSDIYDVWLRLDADAAQQHALAHGQDAALIYEQWMRIDADAAVHQALARGDDEQLYTMIRHGLNQMIPEERFTQWIAGIGAVRQAAAWETYYRLLGQLDPPKAIAEVRRSPHIADEMKMAKAALGYWADKTPEKAAAWVREHTTAGADREDMLGTVAEHWAVRDGVAALALAAAERLPVTARLAKNAAATFALEHTVPQTTEFIRQFHGAVAYDAALAAAAGTLFRGQLEEARYYVIGNRRGDAPAPLLEMLAGWGIDTLADADSAAQAFEQLPVAQLPAEAVVAAAQHIATEIGYRRRVPAAFEWTLRLPDTVGPAVRQKLVGEFKSTKERQQIEAWLHTAPLPAAERAALSKEKTG